ncbi:bifunctional salicylyl-CoA 5-hydroxylase/oxidoreductase [Telluria aromaticivorans]|uniref:Bifunctional salicylyl-CoA 5-hydroxylase/oxidoreductase n=1 Tax=Telluria aromaticivorans TaxID=2725995 RepID=A0A7Y2NYX2_9BURK|nr:bifunctional salicylyl-CoA 5-hydroxylase/oxidoreductase [Telluria aromaticivorans]NNG21926.1 bifunctional salicylyl-CoA 5-hydroxylase/oxidoreductase [Telluria aromaticivorans]
MNIVCVGGGPAGLYFGLLMKKRHPDYAVTVVERNRASDTFGWGVVFSDQTLGHLAGADEESARAILQSFNHWDAIDVHFRGRSVSSGGHGFCGIGRRRLLNLLQERCAQLGVRLEFDTEVGDDEALARQFGADLVVACDGVNSAIRNRHADVFQPEVERRHCRFVWLGTRKKFDAFTFAFEETEHGWFQAHAYQYDGDTSTFIIETPEETWQAAGLEAMDQPDALAFCERLFARYLDGHPLMANAAHLRGSAMWIRFPRIACRHWIHWNSIDGRRVPTVLMGDAAHTAHFSIGSGTKLALEDAIELARCLDDPSDRLAGALATYEAARRIEVLKLQSAARNSMEWFENVARYTAMEAEQFAYSLLTRSQRLSHENLRLRDPAYVGGFERWFAQRAAHQAGLPAPDSPVPPMFTPYKVRGLLLKNRIIVSPMAQYSAVDGTVGDFHLAHLGARALGGAALVMAEMTCVSADARITPGCPGLYAPEHTAAWKRIVDFIHANTDAKIGVQLGHAGAKGSTRPMWDGIDLPLDSGNWPLVSASSQQYLQGVSQLAREATLEDLARIKAGFVRAAQGALDAGFDWIELHCAHGYLLSSFISPLTNRRQDAYGGSLENRCRYPLEVFAAIRAVWPIELPISVRVSAHDWVEGGLTPSDAVAMARLFRLAGADMIDCSSGQVSKDEQPVYGRMFQTPFADRIRNEAGIPTIAVGSIYEADHVNGIISAGRADLCAVARPHLANPAWTLNEAARIGYTGADWPRQYRPGKLQLERNLERERQVQAANAGLSPQQLAARLLEG